MQVTAQCLLEAVSITNPILEEETLRKLLAVRVGKKGYKNLNVMQPNIRKYLLNYGVGKYFNLDALELAIRRTENNRITKFFLSAFTDLLRSSDFSLVLTSIELLIELGSNSKLVKNLSSEAFDELLNDPDPDIRLATISLLLTIAPNQKITDSKRKIIEVLLEIMPEKFNSDLAIDTQLLEDAIKLGFYSLSSKEIRIKSRQKIAGVLFKTIRDNEFSFPLCRIATKTLLRLDDNNLRLIHKQQIIDMLLTGTKNQQILAIDLLLDNFAADSNVINLVLSKLKSPIPALRKFVLDLLQSDLKMNNQQVDETITRLKRRQKETHLLIRLFDDFKNIALGSGTLNQDKFECSYLLQALLHLDKDPGNAILQNLISVYKKLPVDFRWMRLWALSDEAATKLHSSDLDEIVLLYEKDRENKLEGWDDELHRKAIAILEWLTKFLTTDEQKNKLISLLLDDAQNDSDEVSIQALSTLKNIKAIKADDNNIRAQLLDNLKSKRQFVADKAFDILLDCHLI